MITLSLVAEGCRISRRQPRLSRSAARPYDIVFRDIDIISLIFFIEYLAASCRVIAAEADRPRPLADLG